MIFDSNIYDMIYKLNDEVKILELRLSDELFFSEMSLDNKFTIERLKSEIKTLKREIKLLHIL